MAKLASLNSVTCKQLFTPIILSLALFACSDKTSPELEVRQYIADATAAVEARETLAVRNLISEKYSDSRSRDRKLLVKMAMGYFLRHKNIHLFTQISEINFTSSTSSKVKLLVAMAGRPVKGAQALIDIRANLYQFNLTLTKESGDWLLKEANWQRANVDEFLGG